MIKDKMSINSIIQSWNGVEALRAKIQRSLFASLGLGGFPSQFMADAAYNLPFLHAYSVLNDVLLLLKKEGHFNCNGQFIGSLMNASKNKLSWINYNLVDEGRTLRNGIAHYGDILPRNDCWKYIDAIKEELINWDILNGNLETKN